MNRQEINSALAHRNLNKEVRAELKEWAQGVICSFCDERGYDLSSLIKEETARAEGLTLAEYKKANRQGSEFRLTRSAKTAIYCYIKSTESAPVATPAPWRSAGKAQRDGTQALHERIMRMQEREMGLYV